MPGIASDRGPGIQISPIASIGTEIPVTPAITDFMDAFRAGLVTVDDIKRRLQQERLANDAEKTQLQASDFQRQLAPGAFQNAQAAQGLQANQIQAAQQVLPGATSLTLGGQEAALQAQRHEAAANSEDEATRLAEEQFRQVRTYEQLHGHAAPKSINLPAPELAENFSVWFNREKGKEIEKASENFEGTTQEEAEKQAEENVKNFKSSFPLNSVEDNQARAEYANQQEQKVKDLAARRDAHVSQIWQRLVESPETQREYQAHLKDITTRTVKPGDPDYLAEIQRRNLIAQERLAVTGAKVKAIPGVLEARAKAEIEAPVLAAKAQAQASGDVLTELHKSEALKRFEPQFEAFQKVDAIRNSGRAPTNADDIAVLYEFVKLLDPTSAVREGEAKLAQSTVPGVKRVYNQVLGLFTDHNKIMDPKARESMFTTLDTLKQGAIQTIAPEIKRITNIAIDRGVPLDQVFTGPYQSILSGAEKPAGVIGTTPPAGVASRVTQNGHVFRWVGPGPKDYVLAE